ncbi:MAG: tRNA pseudouridine(13) synthase TruD [Planctomycetes bacterium]|nr:tRNA pseudouridine(13) synthase TruD [Planctomycetota bacterium]
MREAASDIPARPWRILSPPDRWIGGRIQTSPVDFRVEEIPLYEPSGKGEHLFVRIEKTGLSTEEAVAAIGKAIGVHPRTIGTAGRKDKHAVAVQTISVPARVEPLVSHLAAPGIRVLGAARHDRKIAPGHLAGNGFRIIVRGVRPGADEAVRATAAEILASGVPNYFGPQRFGIRANNHIVGAALLALDHERAAREIAGPESRFPPSMSAERRIASHLRSSSSSCSSSSSSSSSSSKKALATLSRRSLDFYVNAWQSYVFNRVLEERLPDLAFVRAGDVAVKTRGAAFVIEDVEEARGRIAAGEIELSGPVPGTRSMMARGETGDLEDRIARASLPGTEIMAAFRRERLRGERRALRLQVRDLAWDLSGSDVTLSFSLPAGAFATTVLAEFMGPGPAIPRLDELFATPGMA